jgi:hypothetical protein
MASTGQIAAVLWLVLAAFANGQSSPPPRPPRPPSPPPTTTTCTKLPTGVVPPGTTPQVPPTPWTISFATVRTTFPRLIITSNDVTNIKSTLATSTAFKSMYDSVFRAVSAWPVSWQIQPSYVSFASQATSYLNSAPPQLPVVVSDTATQNTYISLARTIYDRIDYMAMIYQLTGNTTYAQTARKDVYTGPLAEPSWLGFTNCPLPNGFLGITYLSYAVSTAYDQLQPILTQADKDAMWAAINRNAIQPGLQVHTWGKPRSIPRLCARPFVLGQSLLSRA